MESIERAVIVIALSVLSICLIWLSGSREFAIEELVVKSAATAAFVLAFPVVYCWKFFAAPAKLDAELRAALNEATKDAVQLSILKVSFDPNGPTELYVDLRLSNPGAPTILKGWAISISKDSKMLLERFAPRVTYAPLTINALGLALGEDLSKQPLESGGERELRFTFTYKGGAKQQFGQSGTHFRLIGYDVRNREIGADYDMP